MRGIMVSVLDFRDIMIFVRFNSFNQLENGIPEILCERHDDDEMLGFLITSKGCDRIGFSNCMKVLCNEWGNRDFGCKNMGRKWRESLSALVLVVKKERVGVL